MRIGQAWRVLGLILLCGWPLGASEPAAAARVAGEIETLKAQLAAQQQQLQQLQELLRRQGLLLEALQQQVAPKTPAALSTPAANGAAPATDLERVSEKVDAVAEQTAELQGEVGGLLRKIERLGNLQFSGDLRVRYEPFFQAGAEQRHRERARLRFEVTADISKELQGGLRVATGQLEDPITTNQTFTGFFTRKTVGFDRYWLSYQPEWASFLKVTAGKFDYPWYHTELTFDIELQPEGFAQTLSFDFTDSPLANLTLVGFQLPFNELAADDDSFIWGGQVQTHWKLGEDTRLGLFAAGINFRNPDAIARALGTGALQPSQPLSNSVRRDALGNIIGYSEQFAYLNLIAELKHRWRPRWPVRLVFDFVNNLRARRERSGYWAVFELGQSEEKRDWLFSYTFIRVEREAVIGAYNFSDLRASTNVVNHRLRAAYQAHKNVTLEYLLFLGRLFNPQDNINLVPVPFQALGRDPYLKRMQFDIIYKF